jgi:predicted RNase H-like nuclease (RuvC/YqgF family)
LQKEGIPVLEETVDAISLFGDQLCTLNEEQQVEYINALKQIKELSAKNSMLSAEIEKKDQEYQLILDKRDQQVETLEEEIKLLKMQMERMQRNNH